MNENVAHGLLVDLDLCGCTDAFVFIFIYDVLKMIKEHWYIIHSIGDFQINSESYKAECLRYDREKANIIGCHEAVQAFIYLKLTDMDLLEHGGNYRGSWLTDRGERILEDVGNFCKEFKK